MEGSGEIIVDEKLKAIDKRTGRYINVIARTIDNGTSFPIVKYLDKNRKELNYDCVRHLNFDIDIDWELRRYQIVKDLLSNDFDGRSLAWSRWRSIAPWYRHRPGIAFIGVIGR